MDSEVIVYKKPTTCSRCGGLMIFKGVGEYRCEDCDFVEYDEYGKVRLYIEQHRGATAGEIEAATGVKQRVIRQMIKDSRLEVSQDSRVFARCEICGCDIRTGRFCKKCEDFIAKQKEGEKRSGRSGMHGVAINKEHAEGMKRFNREK